MISMIEAHYRVFCDNVFKTDAMNLNEALCHNYHYASEKLGVWLRK